MSDTVQDQIEQMWEQKAYEDALIEAYVPDADMLTRGEALNLALERDENAAENLKKSINEITEEDIQRMLKEIGF